MTCDVILTYSDLRAVHCRSKLGRASRDVGCIDRHFPIVWCAVDLDGAKLGGATTIFILLIQADVSAPAL